jgi:hypothetical protein
MWQCGSVSSLTQLTVTEPRTALRACNASRGKVAVQSIGATQTLYRLYTRLRNARTPRPTCSAHASAPTRRHSPFGMVRTQLPERHWTSLASATFTRSPSCTKFTESVTHSQPTVPQPEPAITCGCSLDSSIHQRLAMQWAHGQCPRPSSVAPTSLPLRRRWTALQKSARTLLSESCKFGRCMSSAWVSWAVFRPLCWCAPRSEAEMAADLAVWHAQRDECLARGPGKVLTIEQKAFYYEHG